LRSGKTLQVVPLSQNTGEYTFVGLEPGDYSFIIVRDANANARWDVGNIETFTNPEQVDRYSKPIKVRANWDVDVSLIPNK